MPCFGSPVILNYDYCVCVPCCRILFELIISHFSTDASFVELQKTLRDATAKFTPSHQSNKANCSVNSPDVVGQKVSHLQSDAFVVASVDDEQIVKTSI
jgi:hypothetical protein